MEDLITAISLITAIINLTTAIISIIKLMHKED